MTVSSTKQKHLQCEYALVIAWHNIHLLWLSQCRSGQILLCVDGAVGKRFMLLCRIQKCVGSIPGVSGYNWGARLEHCTGSPRCCPKGVSAVPGNVRYIIRDTKIDT